MQKTDGCMMHICMGRNRLVKCFSFITAYGVFYGVMVFMTFHGAFYGIMVFMNAYRAFYNTALVLIHPSMCTGYMYTVYII